MRKVDQGPLSPMLHKRITSAHDLGVLWQYNVYIQITAWINHNWRSFDLHYELLFLVERMSPEYSAAKGKIGRSYEDEKDILFGTGSNEELMSVGEGRKRWNCADTAGRIY